MACQIDALGNCLDYPRLRQALDTLPETLDETYARILESIPDQHLDQATTILNLLIWSDREFDINELVDAIATDLDEDHAFNSRNRMPVPRDLLRLCSSLVAVSSNEFYSQYGTVRLAHFSVKEYLVSKHIPKAFQSLIDEKVARSYLARLCLRYLIGVGHVALRDQHANLVLFHTVTEFPFARYSAQSWMDHARVVGNEDGSLSQLVLSFFLENANAFSLFKWIDSPQPGTGGPLYHAARGGLHWAINDLLDHGTDVNTVDGHKALWAASSIGDDTTVQLLIHRGVDVNARNGEALFAAVKYGRHTTAQLLLDKGADTNLNHGETLRGASRWGNITSVKLLLDKGANPNAHRISAQSTPSEAVTLDDTPPVQLQHRNAYDETLKSILPGTLTSENTPPEQLLHRDTHEASTLTALQEALESGYRKLVELLHEGFSRVIALESPPLRAYRDIARLLLIEGADISVPGGEWFDTLYESGWNAPNVQWILERNTYLSASYLSSAMSDPDPQAVTIASVMLPYLTRECAEKPQWQRMSLLYYAAISGSEKVTQRCLDLKVDVHARDRDQRTALHFAAAYGHLVIVKMLVKAGASIIATDRENLTPLELAQSPNLYLPTHIGQMGRRVDPDVVNYLAGLQTDDTHTNKRKRSLDDLGVTEIKRLADSKHESL